MFFVVLSLCFGQFIEHIMFDTKTTIKLMAGPMEFKLVPGMATSQLELRMVEMILFGKRNKNLFLRHSVPNPYQGLRINICEQIFNNGA